MPPEHLMLARYGTHKISRGNSPKWSFNGMKGRVWGLPPPSYGSRVFEPLPEICCRSDPPLIPTARRPSHSRRLYGIQRPPPTRGDRGRFFRGGDEGPPLEWREGGRKFRCSSQEGSDGHCRPGGNIEGKLPVLHHFDLSISPEGDQSSKNRRRGNREEHSAVLLIWKTRGTAGLEGRLRVTAGYPCQLGRRMMDRCCQKGMLKVSVSHYYSSKLVGFSG
jgi:hypothetical protein